MEFGAGTSPKLVPATPVWIGQRNLGFPPLKRMLLGSLELAKKKKINKEINKNVLGTRARLHTNDNSSPRCRRLALECLHHSRQQKGILRSLFYFLIRQTLIIIKKDALPSTHHLACASARLPPRRTGHVKKKIRIYLLPIFLQGRQSREVARFVHNL